jgi:hypothetical protein
LQPGLPALWVSDPVSGFWLSRFQSLKILPPLDEKQFVKLAALPKMGPAPVYVNFRIDRPGISEYAIA